MSTKQTKSNTVLVPMPRATSPLEAVGVALRTRLSETVAKIVERERRGEKLTKSADYDQVESLAAELADNPAAGEPTMLARLIGGESFDGLFLLRDAISAAIVDVANRIGLERFDAALAYRADTAPAWAAHQRERALTIAKLRRLNAESRAYSQAVKVTLAAQGLPCAEILMDAALLGRTDMPSGPGAYFLNQALKADYVTKDEIDNA